MRARPSSRRCLAAPAAAPTSMRSSMAALARPVRTVLKLRFVASTDFSIFSICRPGVTHGMAGRSRERWRNCRAWCQRVTTEAAARIWSARYQGMHQINCGAERKQGRTASSSTVISTSADACADSATRRAASLRRHGRARNHRPLNAAHSEQGTLERSDKPPSVLRHAQKAYLWLACSLRPARKKVEGFRCCVVAAGWADRMLQAALCWSATGAAAVVARAAMVARKRCPSDSKG